MKKIFDASNLKKELDKLKKENKSIVLTNGCFDFLHVGHVRYLVDARKLGDILVVALNSDSSVKQLKGDKRPINSLEDRLEVMAALECVDFVTSFNEKTADIIIETLHPTIYVKGGDYTERNLPEYKTLTKINTTFKSLPFVDGASTSSLIKKINTVYGDN